ncbi:16S rRNA (uracil(1498)-N(3))-methyltransferase [Uliginosibacterium aquaticum]|uniref:Ribosomal RNA small subunit methyltransferase E n=1 Tax=Uliginosibacterium aquaticum TaxID=2731212 RepID=A0ABX2IEV9_9RHOO|nr:16S rRNA (uracil(1498)-N(3))-methyltransferase [Uliginosibacterium aquaticum]NSL53472.1 16S rRNA (uracil(1498)-N(3))-methyltransferase [Uliginosibacterium aquaticum]
MPPRFHCPLPLAADQSLRLPAEVAHHALRVLRLTYGESIVVFDGAGTEYLGELIKLDGEAAVRLDRKLDVQREAPLAVTLVQALAVADKMDWIVQKAVELGAVGVQPVDAERCVLKLAGDRAGKRIEHWRQVAVSAAEQCGRSHLCAVGELQKLPVWLAQPMAGERWILAPEGGTKLSAMPRPTEPVSLLIGPEGGWSDKELAAAQAAGCTPVSLGPRVLRTETAGLAALAAMMALWGDY